LGLAIVLVASWTPVQAGLYDFTIRGSYAETLMDPTNTSTLYTAGDAFTIRGTYDTGLQPVMENKTSGSATTNVTMDDDYLAYPPYVLYWNDHSQITSLTFTGMDLDLINLYYPSDPDATTDGATRNGAFASHDHTTLFSTFSNVFAVNVYDEFTWLHVNELTSSSDPLPAYPYDAFIEYNYYKETVVQGPGSYTSYRHGTLDLTIDSIEITDHVVVPLPGSLILLGSAMATVAGFGKKLRRPA
jgi:hypothetical protein